jgi:hypothetical protein
MPISAEASDVEAMWNLPREALPELVVGLALET